jgi:hypothetical protein
MIGAIAGDIIGSVYEFDPIKTKDFPLFSPLCSFTDDTVLTVAIADAILNGRSYLEAVREIGRRYPDAGYGGFFFRWLHSEDSRPYNSWGNGSAMRVSPIGFAFLDSTSFEDAIRNSISLGGRQRHACLHNRRNRGSILRGGSFRDSLEGHGKSLTRSLGNHRKILEEVREEEVKSKTIGRD